MSPLVIQSLSAFFCTLIAIVALTPLARKVGLVDVPTKRKQHQDAVPLIGGLSVPRPADGFHWRRQQSLPLDGDLFTSFLRADAPTGGR